ncbi:TPA: Ech hydrogenase subunit EchB [Candidatus Sumerlaeota bacterium]|nr:Ech hydrogenase subunit EchB [Candidatus Sumerlaeota bacterium]
MSSSPTFLQYFLTLVVVLVAPLIGGILNGFDRKITSRLQSRIGPPLLQPFYDVFKLLQKKPMVLNRIQIMYAYLHLAFMILTIVILALGQDLLMALFIHAFSTIALVIGGMSVRSPYSRIGGQRQIMQMLAYEPVLVFLVIGIYRVVGMQSGTGSFLASQAMSLGQPLLIPLPLMFVSFFIAILIKLHKSPFDVSTSHHMHQELVKGVTLEYSGPFLALIEITHFYETFLLFALIACFWGTNLLVGAVLAAVCFFGMLVVDNACARLTPVWMVRFMWTVPMAMCLCNMVWFYL